MTFDFQAIASDTDRALHESQLSSLEFVADHLRLKFDGPCLTTIVWPRVVYDSKVVRWGDPGYRDSICALIANRVARVFFANENRTFVIEFEGDKMLEFWPEDSNNMHREALTFENSEGGMWML